MAEVLSERRSGGVVIIEHTGARYDVRETPYGKGYVWRPEYIVAECGCGERLAFADSDETVCRWCGADHTAVVREKLAVWRSGREVHAPWREEYRGWLGSREERSEYQDRLEWSEID